MSGLYAVINFGTNCNGGFQIEVVWWVVWKLFSKFERPFISVEFNKAMIAKVLEKGFSKTGFTGTIRTSDNPHPLCHMCAGLAYVE
ncbi:hypothetical protein CferDRAFT_1520 [Chlorobium ferrooxidans DSM 13031]|uniref:Uncharacterized protein n=1 Tax=Chlorobium ferrooxidans DSM 13031 TaxID=377431 RepID=Q0YSP7_9CHLB|nr:hypothetical protein CferDRAFT_1520 [Chlorobium ferrooxidans DSM 13031]